MEKEWYVIYNGEIYKGYLKYNREECIFVPVDTNIQVQIPLASLYAFDSYNAALIRVLRNKSGSSSVSVYVLNFNSDEYEVKHIKKFTQKYIHFAEDNNKISIDRAAEYIFLTENDVKAAIAKKYGVPGESHTTDTSSESEYDEENPKYIILYDENRIAKAYPAKSTKTDNDIIEFLIIEADGELCIDKSVTEVLPEDYYSIVFNTLKDAHTALLRTKIGDAIYIVNPDNTTLQEYLLYDILDDSIMYKSNDDFNLKSQEMHSEYYDHIFFKREDAERYIIRKTAKKIKENVDKDGNIKPVYGLDRAGNVVEGRYISYNLPHSFFFATHHGLAYIDTESVNRIYYTKNDAEVAALEFKDACDIYIVDDGGQFLKKAKFVGCTKNNITVVVDYEGFSITDQSLLKDDVGKRFFFTEEDAIAAVIEKLIQPIAKDQSTIRKPGDKLTAANIYYYVTPEKKILSIYGIFSRDGDLHFRYINDQLMYRFSEGWAYRIFRNKRDAEYSIFSSKCGDVIYIVDMDETIVEPYILCKTDSNNIICRKSADDKTTVHFDMSFFKDHVFFTKEDARKQYPMLAITKCTCKEQSKKNSIFTIFDSEEFGELNPQIGVIYPLHKSAYEVKKEQEARKESSKSGTIGSVVRYMMPHHIKPPYLSCDGALHNIADYEDLCEFFNQTFGSVNYWGGDGIITFAVPDLRLHDEGPALWGMKTIENKENLMKENTDVKIDVYAIEYNCNTRHPNFFVESYKTSKFEYARIIASHQTHDCLEYVFTNKENADEYARYLNNISGLLKESKMPEIGDKVWIFKCPSTPAPYTKGIVLHSTYYEIIVDTLDGCVKHYSPFDIGYVLFTEKPTESITAKIVDKLRNQLLVNFHKMGDDNYKAPVLFTVEIQKLPALTDIGIVANTFEKMSYCNDFIELCKKEGTRFFYSEEAAKRYKEFLCNSMNNANDAFYKYPEIGDSVWAENLFVYIDGMLNANIISVDHLNAEFYVKLNHLDYDDIAHKYSISDIGIDILYKKSDFNKDNTVEKSIQKFADRFDTSIRMKEVVDLFENLVNDGFDIKTVAGKFYINNPNGTMGSSTILPDMTRSVPPCDFGKDLNGSPIFIIVNGNQITKITSYLVDNVSNTIEITYHGIKMIYHTSDLNRCVFYTEEDANQYLKLIRVIK